MSRTYHSPYCLCCYAPLERTGGASSRCASCDAVNLRDDHRRFWTREPRLVGLEQMLKAVVTGIVVLLFALILLNPSGGTGSGHGVAVGLPILIGVLGWDAASCVTRRRTTWRTSLVIAAMVWVAGVFITLTVLFTGVDGIQRGHGLAVGIAAGCAIALFALGWGVLRAGRAFGAWRTRHIAARQAAR